MKLLLRLSSLALVPLLLTAQDLDNSSLSGDYYFVHLLADITPAGTVSDATNLGGTITFDGAGAYTFAGRQGSGGDAVSAAAGGGTYEVMSNAFVTLTNTISDTLEIDARLGVDSEVLIGSSTSALDGSYDLFVAIKAGAAKDNSLLTGSYTGSTLAFPGGVGDAITTALLSIEADGAGSFTSINARGHAVDAIGDVNFQEDTVATYALAADGSGTATLGPELTLFNGAHDIFVSADGNYLIGFGTEAGAREIFVGVRNFSDDAGDADWDGTYWFAEMIADPAFGSYTSAVGGVSTTGVGVATISERLLANLTTSDFSTVNVYSIDADSRGQLGAVLELGGLNMAIGAPGLTSAALTADNAAKGAALLVPRAVVGAQVSPLGAPGFFHGIFIGIRVPAFAGGAVFLNPVGVINGASFAPPTFPIAAGTIVSLFGSGMAAGTVLAATTPLPTTLGGVVVTINGVPAPLFFVSALQINLQVPFATAGTLATIVVANGGVPSNTVLVPLAATSPGVFSTTLNGLGPGIIVHSLTFLPVTEADPTSPGEFVSILLTGLGALQPPLGDGVAGPVDPLSLTTDPNIAVLFGFEALQGVITFSGAAPGFVGLYQINVIVPQLQTVGAAVPVAILTSNAISDFVTVAVAF